MNFNHYEQELNDVQASYPKKQQEDRTLRLLTLTLGFSGEVGEVCELIKKAYRDDKEVNIHELTKELGDVLAYVSLVANYFDIRLEDVAKQNIEKLLSRKDRDKLTGSGDNR
jgi:NTP pyrophosphatase (non-canonical NTP hydrolase)